MFDFLFADANSAFAISIAIVIALGLLEGLGMLIGLSLMSVLDDVTSFDLDVDTDGDFTSGGLTQFLGWLCLNKLPMLIWLVVIATSFSLSGYSLNYATAVTFDALLPTYISVPVALFASAFLTHHIGTWLAKVLPKNESSAVTTKSFRGLVAEITLGNATKGSPAEAVLQDQFNQKHYVMVEPDKNGAMFPKGSQVVLIKKRSAIWSAIEFKA